MRMRADRPVHLAPRAKTDDSRELYVEPPPGSKLLAVRSPERQGHVRYVCFTWKDRAKHLVADRPANGENDIGKQDYDRRQLCDAGPAESEERVASDKDQPDFVQNDR